MSYQSFLRAPHPDDDRCHGPCGAGAESRQQIGWVIVGGLLLGTFFTLFVVPTVYSLLASRVSPVAEDAAAVAQVE
jgi:multidrug efflux pump